MELFFQIRADQFLVFIIKPSAFGYRLVGESSVSCLESGSWSADTTKTICKGTKQKNIYLYNWSIVRNSDVGGTSPFRQL